MTFFLALYLKIYNMNACTSQKQAKKRIEYKKIKLVLPFQLNSHHTDTNVLHAVYVNRNRK